MKFKLICLALFSCIAFYVHGQKSVMEISLNGRLFGPALVKLQFKDNEVRADTSTKWNQNFNEEQSMLIHPPRAIRKLGKYSVKKITRIEQKLNKTVCYADLIKVVITEENIQHKFILNNVTACCPRKLRKIIFGLEEIVNSYQTKN